MKREILIIVAITISLLLGYDSGKTSGARVMPNNIEEVEHPHPNKAAYTITLTNYHTYITEIETNKTYRVRHEDMNDLFLWLNL